MHSRMEEAVSHIKFRPDFTCTSIGENIVYSMKWIMISNNINVQLMVIVHPSGEDDGVRLRDQKCRGGIEGR